MNHFKARTAKTKQRSEIKGSTAKIYAQKGTGGARHSSRKAPLFVGGGIAHGPKGDNYKVKKINKAFIITLKKHKKYISNYFKNRSNSGFVEGLNNKIKVIKRRCYGIFKTETLFQRLHLDLVGFKSFSVQFS